MRFNKILAKRTLAAALALALGVTSVATVPTNAEAAAGDETILLSEESEYDGVHYDEEVYYSCDVSVDSHVYVEMNVSSKAEFDVDIYSSISSDYWKAWATSEDYSTSMRYNDETTGWVDYEWQQSTTNSGWYLLSFDFIVSAGDTLEIELCFYDGVSYAFTVKGVEIESAKDAIADEIESEDSDTDGEDEDSDYDEEDSSDSSSSSSGSTSTILTEAEDNLTIVRSPYVTIGFTQTLAMRGYDNTEVTWSSSNTSIATINKKGVVTGVSLGKVTITASIETTAGTASSSYKVTVRKNEYTEKKMTLKDCVKGSSTVNVYKIKYDDNGNLIVKVRFLNRTKRVVEFEPDCYRDTRKGILIRDASTGVFASCCNKAIKVKARSYKTVTYTIKKSKLLTKSTCNLAAATVLLDF